jgi:hypothetical protein
MGTVSLRVPTKLSGDLSILSVRKNVGPFLQPSVPKLLIVYVNFFIFFGRDMVSPEVIFPWYNPG